MIRVNVNESFPITVTLIDEETGQAASGQTVYYDIRNTDDTPLSPSVNGTLSESSVEPGIYKTTQSISEAGAYIIYATCSGFISNTEELMVSETTDNDVLTAVYANRHYNISVEDVIRTTQTPTASQAARNVPKGRTDYVITRIKRDEDLDWSDPVAEGRVYAWYRDDKERAPYKMGGPS